VAAEQLDENGDGAGLDDDLCLLCGARGNVGERPCGLKLHERVRGAEELDKPAHYARLDNALNGRVALLGQELAEFCSRLDLLINLLGKDALDHLRELFVQLARHVSLGALKEMPCTGHEMVGYANLALDVAALIVAVGRGSERGARLVSARDATALCEVFLSLCPADLDLLLLAAAAEFVRLKGALGLEGGAAVLGDILVSHAGGDSG